VAKQAYRPMCLKLTAPLDVSSETDLTDVVCSLWLRLCTAPGRGMLCVTSGEEVQQPVTKLLLRHVTWGPLRRGYSDSWCFAHLGWAHPVESAPV
jgi:hypothetical protein